MKIGEDKYLYEDQKHVDEMDQILRDAANIPVLFGEYHRDWLKYKESAYVAGNCIWCNKEVWSSKEGYHPSDAEKNVDTKKFTNPKCLHKLCLIAIIRTGDKVFNGILAKHIANTSN